MKIVFLMKDKDLFKIFESQVASFGTTCILYDSLEDFMHYLLNLIPSDMPQLFILDYASIQHEELNIFEFEKDLGIEIPLIFYNDPYPDDDQRIELWHNQNERFLNVKDFKFLDPIFKRLSDLISNYSMRQRISVICKPQKILDSFSNELLSKSKITPRIAELIIYMHNRLGQDIPSNEIYDAIFNEENPEDIGTLYTYISRAKKFLKDNPELKTRIRKSTKGCYIMETLDYEKSKDF